MLYSISCFVNRRVTRGHNKGRLEREYNYNEIVVDNFETAINYYKKALNEFDMRACYANMEGKCQLVIPHIYKDGTIAYWADSDENVLAMKSTIGGDLVEVELKDEKLFIGGKK